MLYPPVILASASPRRAALLDQLGVPYRVVPSGVEERPPRGLNPRAAAEHLARAKALEVAETLLDRREAVAVLGADTRVILDGQPFDKPADREEARWMLHQLSGREHEVITGVAIVPLRNDLPPVSWTEVTRVYFRPIANEEIEAYLATGRPLDKAGAYGIQEEAGAFVQRIEGCFFNVVGLPLARLSVTLRRLREEIEGR